MNKAKRVLVGLTHEFQGRIIIVI